MEKHTWCVFIFIVVVCKDILLYISKGCVAIVVWQWQSDVVKKL